MRKRSHTCNIRCTSLIRRTARLSAVWRSWIDRQLPEVKHPEFDRGGPHAQSQEGTPANVSYSECNHARVYIDILPVLPLATGAQVLHILGFSSWQDRFISLTEPDFASAAASTWLSRGEMRGTMRLKAIRR